MPTSNLKHSVVKIASLVLIVCCTTQVAFATRGQEFRIMIKNGNADAPEIDLTKEHYSIEVVGGKISSRDRLIDAIWNRNSTLIANFKQTIKISPEKQVVTTA